MEAGVPEGVINVVNGGKDAVNAILAHPDIAAVSFVGATPVAEHIYRTGTRTGNASRRWAGPRTTWWSCPTPTSTRRSTR